MSEVYRSNNWLTALISPGISDGFASNAGSHPSSRKVLLVIGPIETAATPANGH
jgi:hypothetical protein